MSGHCQQDGGFIGDAGCTHQNHQHSELVKRIVSSCESKNPTSISASEAEEALKEGFYVTGADQKTRIGFGKSLLEHIDRGDGDGQYRKSRLMFAVDAVMHPTKTEKNHKGIEGRTCYTKAFDNFGILAISSRESEDIEYVFTIVPKRSGGKK